MNRGVKRDGETARRRREDGSSHVTGRRLQDEAGHRDAAVLGDHGGDARQRERVDEQVDGVRRRHEGLGLVEEHLTRSEGGRGGGAWVAVAGCAGEVAMW